MNEDIKSDSKNLIAFLSSEKYSESKDVLNSLPAYETALIIESSPPKKRALIWQLIEESKEGEILKNLSNDVRDCSYIHGSRRSSNCYKRSRA